MTLAARASRPVPGEHAPYYGRYIALVPDGDIVETLRTQIGETLSLLRSVPESAGGQRYAEGKWSLREVTNHIADTERVFAYRALRFARGDETPLPAFDENAFVANGSADSRTIAALCNELEAVRAATIHLFDALSDAEWDRRGSASNAAMSTRGAAWVCAGHELHHRAILKTRYL